MKKEKICKHCRQPNIEQFLCDTCGTDLLRKYDGIPFSLDCGYGSGLDGTTYDFCTFTCLLKFIVEELKKIKPKDERFIYGGGN